MFRLPQYCANHGIAAPHGGRFIRDAIGTTAMAEDSDLRAKVRKFVEDPKAMSVNSSRRMGRAAFADMVQEALEEVSPGIKVVRIDDPPDGLDMDAASLRRAISSGIGTGPAAVIVVYPGYACSLPEATAGLISKEVSIYSIQELCHQVCVCIKGLHGIGSC